jgi:hypothetical protein
MELDGSRRNTESILGRSIVIFSPSEILAVAESTGFRADVIEKVLHLLNLLNTLNSHPYQWGNRAVIVNNRCRRAGPHCSEPDVKNPLAKSTGLWFQ